MFLGDLSKVAYHQTLTVAFGTDKKHVLNKGDFSEKKQNHIQKLIPNCENHQVESTCWPKHVIVFRKLYYLDVPGS